MEVSPDEMKAAIILFYSLLDEQQRRLYAGLDSMKLGHGGESVLVEFLALIRTPSRVAVGESLPSLPGDCRDHAVRHLPDMVVACAGNVKVGLL